MVFILVFGGLLLLLASPWDDIVELSEGESAFDFCKIKCEDNDYYTSNNNTEFGFIRCECVVGFQNSQSKTNAGVAYLITETIYFDSLTEFKINESVVVERIKG